MAFIEDNDIVETIPADAPDEPFHVWIVPGAPRSGEHFFDEETAYAAAEAVAIDRITIAQQVRAVPGSPRGSVPLKLASRSNRRPALRSGCRPVRSTPDCLRLPSPVLASSITTQRLTSRGSARPIIGSVALCRHPTPADAYDRPGVLWTKTITSSTFWFRNVKTNKPRSVSSVKMLKHQGRSPRVMVTDKLKSYAAARREVMPSTVHCRDRYANNRAEASHRHRRQHERQMRRFKSPGQAQRFLSHSQVHNLFRVGRHLLRVCHCRLFRERSFSTWQEVTCAC